MPRCSSISRAPNEKWTADKIKRMFGTGEQDIQLPAPIWVLLTYQNAFVDEAGKLQTRRDIYNIDSRTLAAIKTERGMIEPDAGAASASKGGCGDQSTALRRAAAHRLVLRSAVRFRRPSCGAREAGAAARHHALSRPPIGLESRRSRS